PGFGGSSGIELQVLDRSGGSFNELNTVQRQFLMDLMERSEIQYAQSSFNTEYPQYEIMLNVPHAKESGVSVSNILSTLQGYIGGIYAADFTRFGKQYRVYVQALPEDRTSPEDLNSMYVRTDAGDMAPITEFV